MSHPEATMQLRRTQRLLYLLAILVFLASMVELLAAKHYKELEQLIPFAIASVGILSVISHWFKPNTWSVRWMQGFMLVSAGASLLGVYFHISGNMEFVRELRPDASFGTALRQGFTGRDPILAPGVLAMGAFLALIASSLSPKTVTTGLPVSQASTQAIPFRTRLE